MAKLFYHASTDRFSPGTVLRGSFRLIENEKQLFDSVVSTSSKPCDLAQVMLRHMRAVVRDPRLKGQYDSTVIEGIAEYVRRRDFANTVSRSRCAFGFLSANAARDFVSRYRQGAPSHSVYEVEAVGRAWLADVAAFNQGFNYSLPFDDALRELAEVGARYWKTVTLDLTLSSRYHEPEVLLEGGARIVAKLAPG